MREHGAVLTHLALTRLPQQHPPPQPQLSQSHALFIRPSFHRWMSM
jgi:hypothetical protein